MKFVILGSHLLAMAVEFSPQEKLPPSEARPSSSKLSQGGAEPRRRCCQEDWRTKAWRGLTKFLMIDSHLQATAVEAAPQEKVLPPDSGPSPHKLNQDRAERVEECCQGDGKGRVKSIMGSSHLQDTADKLVLREKVPQTEPDPGSSTTIPSGQSCSHTPAILTMGSIFKAILNQLDTQFKVALGPLPVEPQDNRSAVHLGRASIKHPGASSTFNPAGHLSDEATGATYIFLLVPRPTEKSTLPSRAQQRPSS